MATSQTELGLTAQQAPAGNPLKAPHSRPSQKSIPNAHVLGRGLAAGFGPSRRALEFSVTSVAEAKADIASPLAIGINQTVIDLTRSTNG